jgi:glycosyltransferase involved in cell wall biosynthesis
MSPSQMTTYNGAPYLLAQLRSLAEQTRKPRELIICDDQSSDNTRAVVEKFARTAPFPVIFHTNSQRLHFADNFFKAASLCSSEYVAFCDQDDVWRSQKMAVVSRTLEATGACLVAHNAAKIDATGRVIGELTHTDRDGVLTGADMHPWRLFPGFTCTFRRDLLDVIPAECRPFDLIDPRRQWAHDRWVAFLASLYGDIYVVNDQLVEYRYHGGNASAWMQTRRSLAGSLNAARHKFGYNLLKQLLVARSPGAADGRGNGQPESAQVASCPRSADRDAGLLALVRGAVRRPPLHHTAGQVGSPGPADGLRARQPCVTERGRRVGLLSAPRPGPAGVATGRARPKRSS